MSAVVSAYAEEQTMRIPSMEAFAEMANAVSTPFHGRPRFVPDEDENTCAVQIVFKRPAAPAAAAMAPPPPAVTPSPPAPPSVHDHMSPVGQDNGEDHSPSVSEDISRGFIIIISST